MSLADRIAGAIGARKSGGWWRTSTAFCHGGDTEGGLAFRTPDDDPEKLIVRCWTRHCHETLEGLNRARDNLRRAAGLPDWQPADPQGCSGHSNRRRDSEIPYKPQNAATGSQIRAAGDYTTKTAQNSAQRRTGSDTAAYAAKLWAVAAVSTGQAPEHHPVSRWLAHRGLWAAGEALPEAVRWLPRSADCFPRGRDDSPAAGALAMAMRPLDDPESAAAKVHLIAIDAQGRKAQHWLDSKTPDKRTFGGGEKFGLLWRGELTNKGAVVLHVCEGLADGLRILRYAPEPAVVAVCAGTGWDAIQPGWFTRVFLWPDADEAGMQAAQRTAQKWANQGYQVQIRKLPLGHDPASAPLTKKGTHGQGD